MACNMTIIFCVFLFAQQVKLKVQVAASLANATIQILTDENKSREKDCFQGNDERQESEGKRIDMWCTRIVFKRIQLPNQITFAQTNVMLPQKLAIFSARRSVRVRCSLAASSSLVTVATFFSVNCSADGPAGRFPSGVLAVLTGNVPFFMP